MRRRTLFLRSRFTCAFPCPIQNPFMLFMPFMVKNPDLRPGVPYMAKNATIRPDATRVRWVWRKGGSGADGLSAMR